MAIRGLIFDFDGLILDTETPEIEVWKEIYTEFGLAYPMELGAQIIGGFGLGSFDPAMELQNRVGKPLDLDGIRLRHRETSNAAILRSVVMPGVTEVLAAAKRLRLKRAIGSSSDRAWVVSHLTRLGLISEFETIVTADEVAKGRTKPHPDIYQAVLRALNLSADEALVLEDSPNGVRAAHTAGVRVIGVPNPVTATLGLQADLMLASLTELPLDEMLARVEGTPQSDEAAAGVRPRTGRSVG